MRGLWTPLLLKSTQVEGELKHLLMRSTDFGLGNLPTELEPGAEAQVTAGMGNMWTW